MGSTEASFGRLEHAGLSDMVVIQWAPVTVGLNGFPWAATSTSTKAPPVQKRNVARQRIEFQAPVYVTSAAMYTGKPLLQVAATMLLSSSLSIFAVLCRMPN